MKKFVLFLMLIANTLLVNSQIETYHFNFRYLGAGDPPCNPTFSQNWKSTHGSPCYSKGNNQYSYDYLRLIATRENGNEKSEGVFLPFTFSRLYKYSIMINAAIDTNSYVAMEVYVANGLTEQKDINCKESAPPNILDKQFILWDNSMKVRYLFQYKEVMDWIPNKDYSQLWIKSLDDFGYRGSFLISDILIYKGDKVDPTPPSQPGNLRATSIGGNTITIAWNASTDNTGVIGYEIFKNGVRIGTTTSTQYTFNGLSTCTYYDLSARAYDNYENYSTKANLNVRTTSGIPEHLVLQSPIPSTQFASGDYTVKALQTVTLLDGFSVDPPSRKKFGIEIVSGCP